MGHLRHKYNKAYYLKEDSSGNRVSYGVEGIDAFKAGGIRKQDHELLKRLVFKNKVVLELGYGRGEAIKYALDNGANCVVGVDFSKDAYAIACDYLEKYDLRAELYCEDALEYLKKYNTQNDKASFDIVLLLDFVEHVHRDELLLLLGMIKKVISDKAIIVINTPVYKVDNDVIKDGLLLDAMDTSDFIDATCGMHCNRYTRKSLIHFMSQAGYYSLTGQLYVSNLAFAPRVKCKQLKIWLAIKNGFSLNRYTILQKESYELAYVNNANVIITLLNKIRKVLYGYAKKTYRFLKRGFFLDKLVYNVKRVSGKNKSDLKNISVVQFVQVKNGPLKGYNLMLDMEKKTSWSKDMIDGCYDSFIYDILEREGSLEGRTIWDVGAHIGYHSLSLAAIVGPTGRVIAFEPNPFNIARFNQNMAENANISNRVKLFSYALGNRNESTTLVFSHEVDNGKSSGSYLLDAIAPEEKGVYDNFSKHECQMFKADKLIADKLVPEPSIVKIDVEGAEAIVLEGAKETLKRVKPLLLFEVHHIQAMHDTLSLLHEFSYTTQIIENAPCELSRCFIYAKVE